MIHIVISITAQPRQAILIYHHFATKNVSGTELKTAHTLRTLLIPFLTKVARGANLRMKVIE